MSEKWSDRERVLMNISVDTGWSFCDHTEKIHGGWNIRVRFDQMAPQFMPTDMANVIGMPLKPGDIVKCRTNPNHPWGISEYVRSTGYSDYVLKLIGGERLMNMSNESLEVLRFMQPSRLYTGAKYRVYKWASEKAFSERYNPDADYYKRCGGVEFDGDQLTIWCRSHIFGMERRQKNGPTLHAQPMKFTMKWSEKTKLKDIVTAMKEQGFANKFEYSENKPDEGNAGYSVFTREKLLGVLDEAISQ